MFYWNQKELLSVVSHRCKKLAGCCWAVTTVKRPNESSGSMEGNVLFSFFWLLKDGQERSALVMAIGVAPINPTSPASHTYWTVALSPNPSESQRSRLTAPPPGPGCIEPQQQMLQAHFERGCYAWPSERHPRCALPSALERTAAVLMDLEWADSKTVAEKFMFGALRCRRAHWLRRDGLKQQRRRHGHKWT